MAKKYIKIKHSIKLDRLAILVVLVISPIIFMLIFIRNYLNKEPQIQMNNTCHLNFTIDVSSGISQTLKGTVNKNQNICYTFHAANNSTVSLFTQNKLVFISGNNHENILQGSTKFKIPNTGIYSIILTTYKESENYLFTLQLESNKITETPQVKLIDKFYYNQGSTNEALPLTYNVVTPPSFKQNPKLQTIVDDVVNLVASKGLPINKLSISLIDLKDSECCTYAQYLDQEPRFPASVAKLFWMVYLYGQYQAGILPEGAIPYKTLAKMIKDSDNESASWIVDIISKTKSGESLPPEEMQQWMQKRLAMNSFFLKANYSPINISQKLFPTDYQKNDAPAGRDLQIRGVDESKPFRNYITSYSIARLLLEIYQEKAISKKYSQNMKLLLKRSLLPSAWKNKEFNAIQGFLGEYLPENAYFASKMGWNFNTRNDAAIIASPDGKKKYILVVFGDDSSFYKNKNIFPELSRLVYERMNN